jgi:hypothetical protein
VYLGLLVFARHLQPDVLRQRDRRGEHGRALEGLGADLPEDELPPARAGRAAGPIFTAGAITQEKDSQTYDILLATPLTNGQIVLGSLLSRLFFVIALLISGIPIFSITQIFGGVAIAASSSRSASPPRTAFVTGALAMAIAVFKVGTRRTIFSFYLFVVIYLVGLALLDQLHYFIHSTHTGATHQDELADRAAPVPGAAGDLQRRDYLPPDLHVAAGAAAGVAAGWYSHQPADVLPSSCSC